MPLVFSLLLFGCVGAPAASPTPVPTIQASATPAASAASVSPTPIGQIQQTATPTTIAPTFNLEAVKSKVEASVNKLFTNLKPFTLDQYTTNQVWGLYYEKELKIKEAGVDVNYLIRVRRPTAEEIRPGMGAIYSKTKNIGGKSVFYEVRDEGLMAQFSAGAISCVSDNLNKAFIIFEIKNKVLNIDDVFNEFVQAC
ncbi:MAG: hypothetical protein NTY90_03035 [Candidatus Micrarchaeota archaeon]|nr:hypothetical protein [Candidatus Micrarchaeota archaeon]